MVGMTTSDFLLYQFSRCGSPLTFQLRWVREFANFARAMCSANAVQYDAVKMRADDELCTLFLTQVAEQHKGIAATNSQKAEDAARIATDRVAAMEKAQQRQMETERKLDQALADRASATKKHGRLRSNSPSQPFRQENC